MSVVFGKRSKLGDERTARLFETIELFLANLQPGAHIVDGYPILAEWLPKWAQWWRSEGEVIHDKTIGVYREFFQTVAESMKDGTQKECFATKFMENVDSYGFDEEQQMFLYGTLMEAGTDTTRGQTNLLLAAAACFPEWVPKARAQLDEICGPNADRLPTFDDYEKLTYIRAVVKEVLRWRPNTADTGAPHALTQDDEYNGYKFEKGTVFTWNAWAISLDPREYKDPVRFMPERFLNDDLDSVLEGQWGFGAGRRVCVGWHVGERNMFITFSRLVYCFDFIEDKANPIDHMSIPQITGGKAPFPVIIKPRSKAHEELILRECKAANEAW